MKAGTTSFHSMLSNHPDIYFSPIKEPNFFVKSLPKTIYTPSKFFALEDYFKKFFPNPLHIAHIQKLEQYERLFNLVGNEYKYLAEGSTAYLHASETPDLIHVYNPDAKIIILVKNGLERAFSHYKMDLGLGRTRDTFQKSMADNLKDYRKGCLSNWSYLGMSLYAENIGRYQQIFKKNVLIISSEELFSKTEITFVKVFNFLEIESVPLPLNHNNKSSNIRFAKAIYYMKKSGLKDLVSHLLPVKARHAAFNLFKKRKPLEMNLSPNMFEELALIFEEDQYKINSLNA